MTYSALLQTPDWKDFREKFIRYRAAQTGDSQCDDCGADTPLGTLRVHHKLYRKSRLPWEYEYDDLRLVCAGCHDVIHAAEDLARTFIRTLPPHVCYEFEDLLVELCQITDVRLLKIALARAKNCVRAIA